MESDSISWLTQHGKYVSLFEPDSKWHEVKMKNIQFKEENKEENKDKNKERDDKDIIEKFDKKLINFNTIVSSLFLLILFLVIIRYHVKN